jgi:hypothetical protein
MSGGWRSVTTKPFRILALDGGGLRGIFTAAVLYEAERAFGEDFLNAFDLMVGTSTGPPLRRLCHHPGQAVRSAARSRAGTTGRARCPCPTEWRGQPGRTHNRGPRSNTPKRVHLRPVRRTGGRASAPSSAGKGLAGPDANRPDPGHVRQEIVGARGHQTGGCLRGGLPRLPGLRPDTGAIPGLSPHSGIGDGRYTCQRRTTRCFPRVYREMLSAYDRGPGDSRARAGLVGVLRRIR